MAEPIPRSKNVGARIRPVEDRKLVSGRGSYLDDIQLPGMAHAAFLRSTHAHAMIKKIDVSKARELPGVLAVRTGKELGPKLRTIRMGEGESGVKPVELASLAVDKVRMVGAPVAVVVATDRYLAEDAVDLIDVEYESLPPEMDPHKASRGEGTPLYEDMDNNIIAFNRQDMGDINAAVRQADLVVKETFRQQRYAHVPMECRGLIAYWNPGAQRLTIWGSLQFAHAARTMLADILELSENKVRVIVPDVGGAFGQKGELYPEDLAIYLTTMELGVPVKWAEDRRENLMASAHAREHIVELEVPVKKDGAILGIRARVIDDIGASPLYPIVPNSWALNVIQHLPNHYKIPAYSWEAITVLSNKSPEAPYRGPGAAVASWAMEGIIDIIARELDLDPVDVRRKNIIRKEDQPYESVGAITLDNLSSFETMEQVLKLIGYEGFREEQRKARKSGRYLGIGIGSFSNPNAASDNPVKFGFKGAGQEVSTVRVQPSGRVQAYVAVSPHGQGLETTLAQILSDELGVPMDTVEILHGDSDMPANGAGTWGDRSAILGGGAVIVAGRDLRRKIIRAASILLEAREEVLDIQDGYVFSRQVPQDRLSVAEIAEAVFSDVEGFAGELQDGLTSTRRYEYPKRRASANGAHAAIVEVDVETGKVHIKRYICVEDVGRAINPTVVEGQIRGCVAQGLGGALLEQIAYDESGQLLTSSFLDYLLPEATDVPDIEVHLYENPSPDTLGGFKNAGEGGICGAISATSNAIADALAPFNVRINRLPLKPDRILEMMGRISHAS